MANIIDYVHWRGDLRFSERPFNDVDAAVLSLLSYLDWADIVPGKESASRKTLSDAADQYFTKYLTAGASPRYLSIINPTIEDMLKIAAGSPRFRDISLSRFTEDIDYLIGRQFAAMTFTLPEVNPENQIVFRGTDLTFVGWKENLDMVYMEQVPAQDSARQYLEFILQNVEGHFLVSGYSKGGNLAVYAAAHVHPNDQERISKILNFDGPGFDFSRIDRVPFDLCTEKITNIVPEKSVVGMLLDSVGLRKVVSCSSGYIMQHNLFHWGVDSAGFSPATLSDAAELLDRTITSWLSQISLGEREAFIEAIFDLLGTSEGAQISKDPIQNLAEIRSVLQKYSKLDKETKALLNQVLGTLTDQTKQTLTTTLMQKLP